MDRRQEQTPESREDNNKGESVVRWIHSENRNRTANKLKVKKLQFDERESHGSGNWSVTPWKGKRNHEKGIASEAKKN